MSETPPEEPTETEAASPASLPSAPPVSPVDAPAARLPNASETAAHSIETPATVVAHSGDPHPLAFVWSRIKEHKIAQWTLAYAAFAFALVHGVSILGEALEWPHIIVHSLALVLIIGLPIAPIIAWYHGVQALKRVTGSELIIIALLLMIGGSLLWLVPRPTAERASAQTAGLATTTNAKPSVITEEFAPPAHSIAVLPFVDMSEKKDQEYFADGMAEEIIDLLVKIPGLKVIGRTSSFQFKGKTEDLRSIGTQLGVAYVLEGSVRKSGNRVRVTAQLIDVSDGAHRWSGSYDRDLVDVLKVQDEISLGLVRALQVSMGADQSGLRPTLKSIEGYNLYLRGRLAYDRLDRAGYDQAASYFRQAMQLEPESALAPAWLAYLNCWGAASGFVQPGTAFEEARRYAERALSLDPRSELAMGALGLVQIEHDWDWAAGAAELDRALEIAPGNARILALHSVAPMALGQWDAAVRDLNASVALDPLYPAGYMFLGLNHLGAGHWSEAEAAFKRALEITPNRALVHSELARALLFNGEKQAALQQIDLEPDEARHWSGRAAINYALGRKVESDAALKRLTELSSPTSAYLIACVHAYRGESDAAFIWLERAFTQKDPTLWRIQSEPFLNSLKGDPRYKAFLTKMNLPE